MVDYLIVGFGLAGISFCKILEEENKSFIVYEDTSQKSSQVAGGLYNPVVLKRFTEVWKAKEQLELALPFYGNLEKKLQIKIDHKVQVFRKFASVEEQNLWFEAADRPALRLFLSTKLIKNNNPFIDAHFGYGEVLGTGRIDTHALQNAYTLFLKEKNCYKNEKFDYTEIVFKEGCLNYKGTQAKNIIFCEGFGIKKNPFFSYLPLDGTKGQLLTIKAPALKMDFVLKSSVFIIPIGEDLYRVGATYELLDKTNNPTEIGKQELLKKLNTFIKCDYEVIDHVAGIRPTVIDRRPLVGAHQKYKNLYVLNGLGTRGVMIAPYVAKQLYQHIEMGSCLEKEIDIARFNDK